MQKACATCGAQFEISQEDLDFYDKISPVIGERKFQIPPPTKCPDCRFQRRLCWRNERSLHRRKCDLTGEDIITIYPPEAPYKVYSIEAWWSDKWDAVTYGREFDFQKSFTENFNELIDEVPLIPTIGPGDNENCPYANFTGWNKNCHLIFNCSGNEDCYYARGLRNSKNTLDAYFSTYNTLCYELVNCHHCYNLRWSQNCDTCTDGAFLLSCTGCRNCIGCVNLANKEFHILNEKAIPEEYERVMTSFNNHTNVLEFHKRAHELWLKHPHRPHQNFHCENVTGEYISNSKNAHDCFECVEVEDCKYAACLHKLTTSYDATGFGVNSSLLYETVGSGRSQNLIGCFDTGYAYDCYYCISCKHCRNCFGCVSLQHKDYCIFNKQFNKEDYIKLVTKIIERMVQVGEWGEFFEPPLSPFPYNETIAQEFFPLTKEEALSKNYKWRNQKDPVPDVEKTIPAKRLPDSIDDIPDDILNWAITCETTDRPFQIIKQELAFYRDQGIPIPHFHHDERHHQRVLKRNPKKMWERACAKCGKEMFTSFAPERPEIVYCEECYLKEVY